MKVAIMTDTNSSILVEEGKKLGIYVLPMPVLIDGEIYAEGVDITTDQLFAAMEDGKNISTSQPSPGEVMNLWDKILQDGYDEIVYIPMDSSLSGSCQMAKQYATEYNGRVQVADTNRVSVTQRYAVYDAIAMVQQGMSAKEICKRLEANGRNSGIYITLDTMEYLRRGGRINSATAKIATVMNIKPVIRIQDGALGVHEKVRGTKKSRHRMIEIIKEELHIRYSHFSKEQIIIGTADSLIDRAEADTWIAMAQEAFPDYCVEYWPLSCSLSSHIGPNGCGIGIAVKNQI